MGKEVDVKYCVRGILLKHSGVEILILRYCL